MKKEAEILELQAKAARDAAEIASLRASIALLQAERDAWRRSLSWRLSAPVRLAGRLVRRAGQAARQIGTRAAAPPPRPTPAPDAPPHPMDPNAPYIFKPAPVPGDAPTVVTLDELYRLSRSL